MVILCGGNIRQCEHYRDRHHFDMSKTRIATKPEDLYGFIHGTLLIMIGTWRKNPDSLNVMQAGKRHELAVVEEA